MRKYTLICVCAAVAIIIATAVIYNDKINNENIADSDNTTRLCVLESAKNADSVITICNITNGAYERSIECSLALTNMACSADEYIYAISERDEEEVTYLVRINTSTGEERKIRLEGNGYMGIVSEKDYIYVCKTKIDIADKGTKLSSYVAKYSTSLELITYEKVGNLVLNSIDIQNGHLILTGFYYDDSNMPHSHVILVNSQDLNIEKTYDTTKHAMTYNGAAFVGDRYILAAGTIWNSKDEMELPNTKSLMLDKYKNVKYVNTGHASKLFLYGKDRIISINYDANEDKGNMITEYNVSQETTKKYILNDTLRDAQITKDILYTLGKESIYAYSINNLYKREYSTKIEHRIEGMSLFTKIFCIM